MTELIQNHAGVTNESTEVQSAVKDWLDGVHLRNIFVCIVRWVRGDSYQYDTMMNMVIDSNCNTHVSWDNCTSWFK